MKDPFLNDQKAIERLLKDYHEHGNLVVAFDFDNTVFDFHGVGDEYDNVVGILREVKRRGWTLILFTAREGMNLQHAETYCDDLGITPDYVNESPIMNTRKPFYNILLDDRAGLKSAYYQLSNVLSMIK